MPRLYSKKGCLLLKDQKRRPEGVDGILKFLSKYLVTIPKSNPKSERTQERYVHEQLVVEYLW